MARLSSTTMLGMSNRFVVRAEPGKWALGSWSQVSGLEVTWDVPDYRAGDEWNYRWTFAGNTKYPSVKMARVVDEVTTKVVKEWLNKNSREAEVGEITIVLHDAHGKAITDWVLKDAFVAKWSVTQMDAGANKLAIETLEISHSGFLDDEKKLD